MKNLVAATLVALVASIGAMPSYGQPVEEAEATDILSIGSEAPALSIGEWVKGEAVDEFEEGHVYVVEFWATWCPPCRTSMPHLSQLQEDFKGKVTFIGISDEDNETVTGFFGQEAAVASEHGDDADEAVKTWGEVVSYTIALDDAEGTSAAYMEAAGQSGIPTAFVVGKDGVIDWIGHPMRIDEPLAQIVDGTWDRDAARQAMIEEQRAEKAMQMAMAGLRDAVNNDDFDAAIAIVDELIAEFPDNDQFAMIRLQVIRMSGDSEKLAAAFEDVAKKFWDDAQVLNSLAWGIAAEDIDPERPLEVAKKIAERACELTEHKDGSILDTLARTHYELGDLDAAIEWQQKAVANGGEMTENLQETLDEYLEEQAGDDDDDHAEDHDGEGHEDHDKDKGHDDE